MSYARFGADGSDVYVFTAVDRGLECCGCILQRRVWVDDPDYPILHGYLKAVPPILPKPSGLTTDEMLAHLQQHRDAGHYVPADLPGELEADRQENDDYIAALASRGPDGEGE